MSVFPTPSAGNVTLALQIPFATEAVIIVRDVLGHEIWRKAIHSSSTREQIHIFQRGNLPAGLYHAVLHVGSGMVVTAKIVLAK